jgi:ethanolamine utilization protein EutA
MATPATLIGLDFGSTTSSAVIASARVVQNAVTGRMELGDVRERSRSRVVLTPFRGGLIDEPGVRALLDAWLADGQVRPEDVLGGGAIVTGLCAQRENASAVARLIRGRVGDAVIAVADDPRLESWLAFMGSAAELSRAHPARHFLNLDIGGGTTNLALGRAGEVLRTGALFVGARHFQVEEGTYRIVERSEHARCLADHLGIQKGPGDTLDPSEVDAIVDFSARLLEAAAAGDEAPFLDPIGARHLQAALDLPPEVTSGAASPIITLSGGVGELIDAHLQGAPLPPTTHYGDLGVDLARRILRSPVLSAHVRSHRPAGGGRAVALGLLEHATEVSGATLHLPRPDSLPLDDLPIVATISGSCAAADVARALDLVRRSPRGGCLHLGGLGGLAGARELGGRIAAALREARFPPDHPLVILAAENVGKAVGGYATEWGRLPVNLIVVDEVSRRGASFVRLGRLCSGVVPLSFYGMTMPSRRLEDPLTPAVIRLD